MLLAPYISAVIPQNIVGTFLSIVQQIRLETRLHSRPKDPFLDLPST